VTILVRRVGGPRKPDENRVSESPCEPSELLSSASSSSWFTDNRSSTSPHGNLVFFDVAEPNPQLPRARRESVFLHFLANVGEEIRSRRAWRVTPSPAHSHQPRVQRDSLVVTADEVRDHCFASATSRTFATGTECVRLVEIREAKRSMPRAPERPWKNIKKEIAVRQCWRLLLRTSRPPPCVQHVLAKH